MSSNQSQKVLKSTTHLVLFITMGMTQEQPDGIDASGKAWGKGTELPSLSESITILASLCVHCLRSS